MLALLVAAVLALQPLAINAAAAAKDDVAPPEAWGPVPSATQLQYHEEELSAFIHYGVNTYTGAEWGTGKENPNVFNPTNLDTDQWVKSLKDAGFKRIIMIGRHHDGFCLWKSQYTTQDVESSTDFQATQAAAGKSGDVFEELSKSCTKYDMDMGLYLSPWDANNPSYGYGTGTDDATDSNGDYNEYYMNQLREVLGNPKYGNDGKFVEVWMDGAKGSGAAAQKYKFQEWFDLIEELQPGAVVFSPYGSTVRWIGNEAGKAGEPCWSKLDQMRQRNWYDAHGGDDADYLNTGDPNGDIWSIGECDVSLTSGWFWKDGKQPKSMDELTDIYFKSVGRGQPLLLNVPPDIEGKLPQNFVDRVAELGETIQDSFRTDLVKEDGVTASASAVRGNSAAYAAANVLDDDADTYWTMDDGQTTGSLTIDLGGTKKFDIVSIEEYIKLGQRISGFTVEAHTAAGWQPFGSGQTIGAKRLVRGTPVSADQIRISITGSQAVPLIENVGVFRAEGAFEQKSIMPDGLSMIDDRDFTLKGTWNQETISGVNETGIWANPSAEASFTFTGTKAWIVGTKDPNHGTMDVYIDGKLVATPDANQATRALKQILYVTDDLTYGEHTVRMVCKNKATGLDAAFVLGNNGAGMFEIDPASYTVDEGKSQNITIKRVGGTTGEVTVEFQTAPDTAVHGRHYNDVSKTVTFADGQDTATVAVETIENQEITGDLRFFAEIVDPKGGAILGFNPQASVIIKDNDTASGTKEDLKELLDTANEKNEGLYTAATWTAFQQAKGEAQAVYDNADATSEQIQQAITALQNAQTALAARTAFTADDPFVFPKAGESAKLAEAEFFTLAPIAGDSHVRVEADAKASNGKKVSWMEPGNVIKLPYTAQYAGTYTVECRYQSGRLSEGTANAINWSGENITSGSVRVYGDNTVPYKTVSMEVVVTKPGAGELVITADSNAGPNLDKFEFTGKDLVVPDYTITASAGENGTIDPAGEVKVDEGASQVFTITANSNYEVADVLVDGESVGAVTTYTFEDVTGNHTIAASFRLINKDALKELLDAANEKNEGMYTAATWTVFLDARETAQKVYDDADATGEQIQQAQKALQDAQAALAARTAYTADDPFVFPEMGESAKLAEAEFFTLVPITGDKYVRIENDANASNGKKVGWMEPGNVIKLPYTAEATGTYTVECRYQSGRLSADTANAINWSGENITSGSVRVYGDNTAPYKTVSLEVVVTKPGAGELVITADDHAGPNLDKFEFTAKEIAATGHTVTATAGENGTITPSGEVKVEDGASQEFTIEANNGYEIADVLVDGKSVSAVKTYTFENVTENHAIAASFRAVSEEGSHMFFVQWNANAELEVEGNVEEVIVERDGVYSAQVTAGETLKLHFTPANGPFNAVTLNGKAIPFEADGFTYSTEMPGADTTLYFSFTVVTKALLETALHVASAVTDEELDNLADTAKKNFISARDAAQKVFEDEAATQVQVNDAWKRLVKAIQYLSFEKGDIASLGRLLEIAADIDPELFTESSYEGFEDVRQKAQETYDLGGDALKADVEEAYNTLKAALEKLVFKTDLSSLQSSVDYAKSLKMEEYLPEGQEEFQAALKAAEAVLTKGPGVATQDEADAAAKALATATGGLRKIPTKDMLKALVEKAEQMDLNDYTNESVGALEKSLKTANEVLNNPAATPKEILTSYNDVQGRIDGLENRKHEKPSSGGSGSSSSGGNTYGEGTAAATTTAPVIPVTNPQAQVYVISDTTLPFAVKRGGAYCFKMTVVGSTAAAPSFTVGNGGTFKTQYVAKIGNDYYFRVWATGTPGARTGVYTTLPGQNPKLQCVVTVG